MSRTYTDQLTKVLINMLGSVFLLIVIILFSWTAFKVVEIIIEKIKRDVEDYN